MVRAGHGGRAEDHSGVADQKATGRVDSDGFAPVTRARRCWSHVEWLRCGGAREVVPREIDALVLYGDESFFVLGDRIGMTELIYYSDSYTREFQAAVVEAVGDGVVLDQTAFYPGGGGQPSDIGRLVSDSGEWTVPRIHRSGGRIVHQVSSEPPPTGSSLTGILNWDRRYALMRTHTAMHILCGVIWRDYGASVTGSNMQPLRGRMDFEFDRMRRELVREIEDKINVEAAAGRAVGAYVLPREEAFQVPDLIRTKINLLPPSLSEVRVVEIEGLDLQADGGIHVANTSEVGRLRIVDYKSKGRINKRLVVQLEVA